MAPILKSRRRAHAEIQELNQWFSGILDDQSNFMRYENVIYPELTYDQANAGWDENMIDDEYHTGHQIWHFHRIEALTREDSDKYMMQVLPSESNRWTRFRIAFPVIITTTTAMLILPLIIQFIIGVLFGITSWFFGAEDTYLNPEQEKQKRLEREQIENDAQLKKQIENNDNNNQNQLEEQLNPILIPNISEFDSSTTPNSTTTTTTTTTTTSTTTEYQQQLQFSQPIDFIYQQDHQERQRQQYINKIELDHDLPLQPQVQIVEELQKHEFIIVNEESVDHNNDQSNYLDGDE